MFSSSVSFSFIVVLSFTVLHYSAAAKCSQNEIKLVLNLANQVKKNGCLSKLEKCSEKDLQCYVCSSECSGYIKALVSDSQNITEPCYTKLKMKKPAATTINAIKVLNDACGSGSSPSSNAGTSDSSTSTKTGTSNGGSNGGSKGVNTDEKTDDQGSQRGSSKGGSISFAPSMSSSTILGFALLVASLFAVEMNSF